MNKESVDSIIEKQFACLWAFCLKKNKTMAILCYSLS